MTRRRLTISAIIVAFLTTSVWFVFGRSDHATTVHADFSYINGIYPGSKVTVLGVPVGRVTAVEPQGATVRVTMTLPADVALSADPHAYVLSPALISDRSVDLGPAAGNAAATLTDGHIIPVEHTHAPITFDSMLGSLTTLTAALGPDQGDLSQVLDQGAAQWRGQGAVFNDAIRHLGSATGVLGARSEDIGAVVANLSTLMDAFDQRQVSLSEIVSELGDLGGHWATSTVDIREPLQDLKTVLDEVNAFVTAHGDDTGTIAANLNAIGDVLTARQPELAEFMDLVPLMMQNLSNTIGPDRRGRIRLNVSTALTQFAAAQNFCDQHLLPICIGAGITNPISYPISRSDPLGIVTAVTGQSPPPNPRYPR